MGWDGEQAESYRKISESLGQIAGTLGSGEDGRRLEELLLGMRSSYQKLAGYYQAREETAHLRCGDPAIGETEEDRRASLEVRAIYTELQEQWAVLAAELEAAAGRQD
jgi:hypothetical protein